MKMFKKFLAMFNTSSPSSFTPPPRGRVSPDTSSAAGNGAMKAVAAPIPKVKYRVYRAESDTWEDFKDAQVKPEEGLN